MKPLTFGYLPSPSPRTPAPNSAPPPRACVRGLAGEIRDVVAAVFVVFVEAEQLAVLRGEPPPADLLLLLQLLHGWAAHPPLVLLRLLVRRRRGLEVHHPRTPVRPHPAAGSCSGAVP